MSTAVNPPAASDAAPDHQTATIGGYRALGVEAGTHCVVWSNFTDSIQSLPPRAMDQNTLRMVVGPSWAIARHPRFNQQGELTGANWSKIADEIARDCVEKGVYRSDAVRGPGVYVAPDDPDVLIINSATLRRTDGKAIERSGEHGFVYPAHSDIGLNAAHEPADAEAIAEFEEVLATWRWARQTDARLLLGWAVTSLIPGALDRRPYALLTGPRGTAKSTMLDMLRCILGKTVKYYDGKSTAAGVRQDLAGTARGIMMDEAEAGEASNEARRIGAFVDMLRSAYSDGTDGLARGTPGQGALMFKLNFTALIAQINPPPMNDADRSRCVVLELDRLPSGALPPDFVLDEDAQREFGKAFRARALAAWPVLRGSMPVFKTALVGLGRSGRFGDTLGTLLAAYWALMHDAVATEAEALELINSTALEDHAESEVVVDETDALDRLLDGLLRIEATGKTLSVRQAIVQALLKPDPTAAIDLPEECRRMLVLHGIGVDLRQQMINVVSNPAHPQLRRLYAGSRYEIGGWSTMLGRIPGAQRNKSVRLDGAVRKCVRIPLTKDIRREAGLHLSDASQGQEGAQVDTFDDEPTAAHG
ncbi:MAG: hypothetical protein J5I92_15050 [Thiogranum sp.]|nr:hypothetical protein [Thiogranum sp.]